ncbi:hypothetical protein G7054_g8321 [Neopestalotiopsis clavispora]|nr:hypothetical protein G7054_g8321 [Neopestalotiopsis clavispora]
MPSAGAGRIAGEMKWHVYRYPQKPGTLMSLGSILTRPDDLESSLNYTKGMEPFLPDQICDQTDAVQRVVKSELKSLFGGRLGAVLPINPMISAGGSVEGHWSKDHTVDADITGITARSILPQAARDWVESQLTLPSIERYIKDWSFHKSLYVIVGVATCKRISVTESKGISRNASLGGEAQVALAGVTVEAGISASRDVERGTRVEIEQECDFAYRIREFVYSRRKKQLKGDSRDVIGGAMFNFDNEFDFHGQHNRIDIGAYQAVRHDHMVRHDLLGRFVSGLATRPESDDIPVLDYIEDHDQDFHEDSIFIT